MLTNPIGIYPFFIKSYESDQFGKMSLSSFFHYLQECAYRNAQDNGFGFDFVEKENSYWVLTRVLVQLKSYPNWQEKIQIKTWPRGAEGFFALRDYQLIKNEEILANISSSWMIIDKASKRPRRMEDVNLLREGFVDEKAIDQHLDKIFIPENLNLLEERKVYPSDMDVNGHVNNATYVRWVSDAYYSHYQNYISEFEINFLSELKLNDEFNVYHKFENGNYYYVLKNTFDKEICRVRIC